MSRSQSTASLEWTCVEKKPPKNVIVQSSSIFKQNHQKSPLEIEAERNYNDQKKIDYEVLVTGFITEPKKDHWMELIKLAGIETDKIINHGCFKGQSGKFFITIGFKNKISQELFVNEIRKSNRIIYVHKRLTKFNSSVEKELRELRESGAIYGFIFKDYQFQAKFTEHSSWTIISTQHAFKKFTIESTEILKIDYKTERKENFQKQQELERQICVQGFIFKPEKVNDIVAKFMDRFGLSFDDVIGFTINKHENKWTIFIQLSENSAMRKILKAKNKKIRLSYLLGYKAGDLVNPFVTWKRVLTEFNDEVNAKLSEAYESNKIHKFEFADHRFRVKVDQFSSWVQIGCYSDLDGILKLKKNQIQTVKNTSLYKFNSVESMSTSMSVMSVSSGSRM